MIKQCFIMLFLLVAPLILAGCKGESYLSGQYIISVAACNDAECRSLAKHLSVQESNARLHLSQDDNEVTGYILYQNGKEVQRFELETGYIDEQGVLHLGTMILPNIDFNIGLSAGIIGVDINSKELFKFSFTGQTLEAIEPGQTSFVVDFLAQPANIAKFSQMFGMMDENDLSAGGHLLLTKLNEDPSAEPYAITQDVLLQIQANLEDYKLQRVVNIVENNQYFIQETNQYNRIYIDHLESFSLDIENMYGDLRVPE